MPVTRIATIGGTIAGGWRDVRSHRGPPPLRPAVLGGSRSGGRLRGRSGMRSCMARELSEVGVVGLGTMGAGIVEVFARAGLSVTAVEVSEGALERGRGHL